MFTRPFGIEVEFTGITRKTAADVAASYLTATIQNVNDYYDTYNVYTSDGRIWKFTYDGSIRCQKKEGRRTIPADSLYSVELVQRKLSFE